MHTALYNIFIGAAALLNAFEGGFANRAEAEPGETVTCYIRQTGRPNRFKYDIGFAITVPKERRSPAIACRHPAVVFEGGKNSLFEQQVKKGFFSAQVVGESKNRCKCTDKDGKMYMPLIAMDSKKNSGDKNCDPPTCWDKYEHVMKKAAQKIKSQDSIYVLKLSDESMYESDANSAMKPRLPTQLEMVNWEGDEQAEIEIEKAGKQMKQIGSATTTTMGDISKAPISSTSSDSPSERVDGPAMSSDSPTCDEAIIKLNKLKARYQTHLNNIEWNLWSSPIDVLEELGKLLV